MKDTKRLQDILDAIEAIEAYSVSSYDEFVEDHKTQDAILYNLIIIGEAANQISEDFQEEHFTIPWSSMIGTRNIIVHGYDQVKLQIVWEILKRDLDHLKKEISKVLGNYIFPPAQWLGAGGHERFGQLGKGCPVSAAQIGLIVSKLKQPPISGGCFFLRIF